jgi:hypothetical protein
MKGKKELLAYCGAYCGDCLGYTGVIADAAEGLKKVLEKYQFEKTAQCVFPGKLKEYDSLYQMLEFMTDLRCPGKCREGKDTETSCAVRKCCREKGFYACYECDELERCEKLRSLFNGLHYEADMQNLKDIREMGLEAWLSRGKRHVYWENDD